MNLRKDGFWQKVARWFKEVSREKPGCGKCAVCHHVCSLLEKRSKRPVKVREE